LQPFWDASCNLRLQHLFSSARQDSQLFANSTCPNSHFWNTKFPVFHPKWREGLQYWIAASSFVTNSPPSSWWRFQKLKLEPFCLKLWKRWIFNSWSLFIFKQEFITGINLDNLFIFWDSDSIYQLFILCGPPCPACMDGCEEMVG